MKIPRKVGRFVADLGLSEIVRDLVRQMLRLRFSDDTIIFHLKAAKVRNAKQILRLVLNEAKQEAIARLDLYAP